MVPQRPSGCCPAREARPGPVQLPPAAPGEAVYPGRSAQQAMMLGRSHSSLEESTRDTAHASWDRLKADLSQMFRAHEAELDARLDRFLARAEPRAELRGEGPPSTDGGLGFGRGEEAVEGPRSQELLLSPGSGEVRRGLQDQSRGSTFSVMQQKRFAERLLERSVSFNSLQRDIAEPNDVKQRQPSMRLAMEGALRKRKFRKPPSAIVMRTPMQRRLLRLTSSSAYEVASAAVIVLNAATIAWETELRAGRAWDPLLHCVSEDLQFILFSILFAFLFTLDLSLRIAAERAQFFNGSDFGFNIFDLLIVGTSVVESVFRVIASTAGCSHWTATARNLLATASMLRAFRLLRVIQFTKALRSLLFFRELRIMVSSLCGALVSLLWSIVIFIITFFIFGVFFTDGAIYFAADPKNRKLCAGGGVEEEKCKALKFYYGGLFDTMASLYWAMAGGEDWGQMLQPLHQLHIVYVMVFYLFITFSMFAMLNVVTSVFVDSTMQRSQNDREFVVQCEMKGKTRFIETMAQVFDELDTDGSEQISLEELEDRMNDPHMIAYFSALSLDMRQVGKLFHLMDSDRSGHIDREEFISGCFNLKGAARNLDIAILQHETRRIALLVLELGGHMDEIAATTAEALATRPPAPCSWTRGPSTLLGPRSGDDTAGSRGAPASWQRGDTRALVEDDMPLSL